MCHAPAVGRRSDSLWTSLALAAILATGTATAAVLEDEPSALLAAVKNAVARGQVERTRMLGFGVEGQLFEEAPPEGAVLVGFEVGLGQLTPDLEGICALRPIYRTGAGEVTSAGFGSQDTVARRVTLKARPGYAVGGVTLRTGLYLNGLSLTFLWIEGDSLDPQQSYSSDWVGDRSGGREATIGGSAPVVGVFGNQTDKHVRALGLVYLKKPGAPQPAAAPPPGQPPPGAPVKKQVTTYRNHEHNFSLDLPEGWRLMAPKELELIDEFLRQRMLSSLIRYDTGFRPTHTSMGMYPYILVQAQHVELAGKSYEEIQGALDLGISGSTKIAEAAVSDVGRDLSVGNAVLDRSRDRFLLRGQMDVGGIGKVQGLSVCHLGAHSAVSVHCYAKDSSFEGYLPVFMDLNNTFAFDKGHEFVPARRTDSSLSWLPVVAFAGVTLPLCLTFLFLGKSRRNGVNRVEAPPDLLDVLPANPRSSRKEKSLDDALVEGLFKKPGPGHPRADKL